MPTARNQRHKKERKKKLNEINYTKKRARKKNEIKKSLFFVILKFINFRLHRQRSKRKGRN